MRTIKLYDETPYDRRFTAVVTEVEEESAGGAVVTLDQTLFFPEEGGQTSDTGYINGHRVTHVTIEDGVIYHETEACGLKAGDKVTCDIDWEHRFSNMQNHTGEHILSGLLHRLWGSENVGFHLSDSVVTLDTSKALERDQLNELERRANEAVWLDLPVLCRYYSPDELDGIEYRSKKEIDGDIRLVAIPDVDLCACCAPHVRHTGEIGIIKIVHAINYKGGMRLTILSGRRAYEYLSAQQRVVEELSHRLSENPDKLVAAVERLLGEISGYKIKNKEVARQRLEDMMNGLDPEMRDAVLFTEDVDNIVQRNAVNALAGKYTGICAVFSGNGEGTYRYILSYPGGDAREAAELLKKRFGAKGGGSVEMVQGSITADREDIMSALERIGR